MLLGLMYMHSTYIPSYFFIQIRDKESVPRNEFKNSNIWYKIIIRILSNILGNILIYTIFIFILIGIFVMFYVILIINI